MSQALASARKRREPPEPVNQQRPGPSQSQTPAQGFTLPQVIALVDKRLIALELGFKEIKSAPTAPSDIPANLKEVLDEYGSRFDIIADELASLKNMMLSLQAFTMDVNKSLVNDRIRILSDVPSVAEEASANP